ncbi:MAG: hypothetical protein AAGA99_21200 [Actinomycetota bacterium]
MIHPFEDQWREITVDGQPTGWVRTGIRDNGVPGIVDATCPDKLDGYVLPERAPMQLVEQRRLFVIEGAA